jgi:hypothetical protein
MNWSIVVCVVQKWLKNKSKLINNLFKNLLKILVEIVQERFGNVLVDGLVACAWVRAAVIFFSMVERVLVLGERESASMSTT